VPPADGASFMEDCARHGRRAFHQVLGQRRRLPLGTMGTKTVGLNMQQPQLPKRGCPRTVMERDIPPISMVMRSLSVVFSRLGPLVQGVCLPF
jgi:hypothetical protein